MKKIILLFALIISSTMLVAQTYDMPLRECQLQDSLSNIITVKSDDPDLKMPEYEGGVDNMIQFIWKNLRYPVKAMNKKESGKVVVEFTIETDGQLSNIRVKNSVSKLLDAEALRVVCAMPNWTPCEYKGEKVRFIGYTLPLVFRLG